MLVAVFWILVSTAAVRGQSIPGVELQWDVPESCPETDAVLNEAGRLIGDTGGTAPATVEIEIQEREDGSWRLWLEIDGEEVSGERELSMGSCREVRETAALLIALALDPEGRRSEATREQIERVTLPPESEETVAVRPEVDGPDGEQNSTRGQARFEIGLLALLDTDLLPRPTPGFGPSLALLIRPLRVQLWGGYFLPQSASVAGGDQARISLFLAAGGLELDYLFTLSAVDIGPCLGAELGYLGGQSQNVDLERSDGVLWSALQGGVTFGLKVVEPLSLKANAVAVLPLRRPEFALLYLGTAHRTAEVSFRFGLGAALRF